MSEADKPALVEPVGAEVTGLRPYIFVTIRDTSGVEAWFIRGDATKRKVTISTTAVPQAFWRVHLSARNPEWFNFQCYDGAGALLWLAGNSSNKQTFVADKQGEPGCAWRCEKYPHGDGYQIFCQDVDPGIQMIDGWSASGEIMLSTQTHYWEFETFKTIQTLAELRTGYARFLAAGDPIAGNPPNGTIFIVSGYETEPPLREVWFFNQVGAPSTYQISVFSDLNGPKYLAGDTQSGRVFLTDAPSNANAQWIIEQAQPYYFSIRQGQGEKRWLMRDENSHIELKSEPWSNWVLQPLATLT